MLETSEYQFVADDGLEIQVERVEDVNHPQVKDLVDSLTAQGRASWEQHLAVPDVIAGGSLCSATWLALAHLPGGQDTPVAVGRYEQVEPGRATLMVAVRENVQRKGIGSRLFHFLLEQARAAGIRRVVSKFDASDEAVWQLLHYSPYHLTWQPCGREVEVTIYLQPRPVPSPNLN